MTICGPGFRENEFFRKFNAYELHWHRVEFLHLINLYFTTMSGKYFTATDQNFKSSILEADKVALVDFWAAWCGPCMMLGPVIDELAGEYEGKAIIAKVNVDENPNTAAQYGIRSIPTMLIIKNGQVVDQMVGAMPKNMIAKKIDEHIG